MPLRGNTLAARHGTTESSVTSLTGKYCSLVIVRSLRLGVFVSCAVVIIAPDLVYNEEIVRNEKISQKTAKLPGNLDKSFFQILSREVKTMPEIPEYLAPSSAAKLIGMSSSNMRLLARSGIIPAKKVATKDGFAYRIKREDVFKFRESIRRYGKQRGGKLRTNRAKRNSTRFPGFYVYGWHSDISPLPFYVGCGSGNRAANRHYIASTKAPCQVFRESCQGFSVKIYVYRLEEEEGKKLESLLIRMLKLAGGCQYNTKETPVEFPEFSLDDYANQDS